MPFLHMSWYKLFLPHQTVAADLPKLSFCPSSEYSYVIGNPKSSCIKLGTLSTNSGSIKSVTAVSLVYSIKLVLAGLKVMFVHAYSFFIQVLSVM